MLHFQQDTSADCTKCMQLSVDPKDYKWIHQLRIGTLIFSTTLLAINIALIIIRKQYRLKTLKLFLFVQIFYAFSMISVIPHDRNFNLKQYMMLHQKACNYQNFMNCLITQGQSYKSAIQGFFNLTCYGISYWLAVCISLHINQILEENHNSFLQRKRLIIFFLVIFVITLWYLVPFILSFYQGVPFSFGPTGYRFKDENYFFYSGIMPRKSGYEWLVVLWMFMLPTSLFAYHLYLHCVNKQHLEILKQQEEITQRQWFLIKISKLSLFLFIVQFVNVLKLFLGLLSDKNEVLMFIVFIFNSLFDFMAMVLFYIYIKYIKKEGMYRQAISQILIESQASSHGNMSSHLM